MQTPIGFLQAEKMAEVVLLNVVWIGFSTSPLQISVSLQESKSLNNMRLLGSTLSKSSTVSYQTYKIEGF